MKKIFLTGLVLLFAAAHLFAVDNTEALWQKGNDLYKQKQYDSAAYCYEQIAMSKPHNAEVYYNLGNAYYRMNKVGLAILNYERALHVDPGYKDAKDNLLLAQARISNRMQYAGDLFFIEWWNSLTAATNQKTLAILSLCAFLLIVAVLLFNRLQKPGNFRLPPQVPGMVGFIWICLMIMAFTATRNSTDSTEAVVIQNDAPLMNVEQKGKPISLIPEGTVVKLKTTKGEYVEVRLPDGRIGWLQQTLINKI